MSIVTVEHRLNVRGAMEAPISKHQIPNNTQIPILNDPNGIVSDFDHSVIGKLFGIWDLNIGICPRISRVAGSASR